MQKLIPNGNRVPHPCVPNALWEGVGHFSEAGGGHLNPFGQDFQTAGQTWTEALCRKDSDGDGKTNGQELGDPDCTWRPIDSPKVTSVLSHPGVCEPLSSPKCQQRSLNVGLYRVQEEWMAEACKSKGFECDGLTDADVKNVTFRFPKTPVPAEETTYMCAVFDFPERDGDFHMIATSPVLDNRQVMHHAVVFGCKGEIDKGIGKPYKCGMIAHRNCSTILSIWTLGQNGECYHGNGGMRLGVTGYTRLALQFHWNNPELATTYQDASGMTLYYTPKLRPNDAGVWMVGSDEFDIPPRRETVEVHAVCTPGCTQKEMTQSIYVTAAWNHMHYLGVSETIEHYRDGVKLRDVTNDVTYSYDSPKTHEFPTPFEVRPGDELRTTCRYNSMSRTKTTVWGDSTQQEMCYGFLYYYPAQALRDDDCVSFRGFIDCDNSTLNGCNPKKFWGEIESFMADVDASCAFHTCYAECKERILRERDNNACLANEDYMMHIKRWSLPRSKDGIRFMAKLSSCEAEINAAEIAENGKPGNSASTVTCSLALILLSYVFQ